MTNRMSRIASLALITTLAVTGTGLAGAAMASASTSSHSAAAPTKRSEADRIAKDRDKLVTKFEEFADKVDRESAKFTTKAAKKPTYASIYTAAATDLDELSVSIRAAAVALASATSRSEVTAAKAQLREFNAQRSTIRQDAETDVADLQEAASIA